MQVIPDQGWDEGEASVAPSSGTKCSGGGGL